MSCEYKLEWINQDEFSDFFGSIKKNYSPDDAPFTVTFPLKFTGGSVFNAKFTFCKADGFWFEDWDIDERN